MQRDASALKPKPNWLPWAGFVLSAVAFASYFAFFYRFPVTRDVPWVSFLLFAAAAVLLVAGLRRALARPPAYRGKIAGPILTALSVAIFAFFCLAVFVAFGRLPASHGSPAVGQKAPAFALPDTAGRPVSLAELLATPVGGARRIPKGVLLVFYRGYW